MDRNQSDGLESFAGEGQSLEDFCRLTLEGAASEELVTAVGEDFVAGFERLESALVRRSKPPGPRATRKLAHDIAKWARDRA